MSKLTTTTLPNGDLEVALTHVDGSIEVVVTPAHGDKPAAKWMTVENVPAHTTDKLLMLWHDKEWTAGAAAARRTIAKGHTLTPQVGKSLPWRTGWDFAQLTDERTASGLTDDAAADLDERILQASALASGERTMTRHQDRRAAYAAADALIADSNEASMVAEVEHYQSDELQAALAVVERFGQYDAAGCFYPNVIRRHEQDGERLRHTANGTLSLDVVMPRVYKALNDKAQPIAKGGHSLGRVDFVTSADMVTLNPQGFYDAEPGSPQIVFLSMTEGSAAYGRGEHAWACWFQPTTYVMKERPDAAQRRRFHDTEGFPDMSGWDLDAATGLPTCPETGRIHSRLTGEPVITSDGEFVTTTGPKMRSAWTQGDRPGDAICWGGVLATYSNTTLAREAMSDLRRALATIRKIDAERSNPTDGTLPADIYEDEVKRAFVPTPVL